MSTHDIKNVPVIIHQSTVSALTATERFFLDLFVKEGTYRIVPDGVT